MDAKGRDESVLAESRVRGDIRFPDGVEARMYRIKVSDDRKDWLVIRRVKAGTCSRGGVISDRVFKRAEETRRIMSLKKNML